MNYQRYVVGAVAMATIVIAEGCYNARGFDRGAMRQQMNRQTVQVTDDDIQATLARRPQIQFPMRIAVVVATSGYSLGQQANCRLTADDIDSIMSAEKDLKDEGIVSDMVIVSEALIERSYSYPSNNNTQLKNWRLAAARYGADALLVVNSTAATDRDSNVLSLLYLTIAGFWVSPGTRCDALYMMDGVLVDVRNEYVYATVQSEGTDHVTRPLAILDEAVAVDGARAKAVEAFKPELLKRIRHLYGMAPVAAAAKPQSGSDGRTTLDGFRYHTE